jgi:hypothetical protein
MKRAIAATLTGVALILCNAVLPLASAAETPSVVIGAPVAELESYQAPVVERDTYEVTPAPALPSASTRAAVQPGQQSSLTVKTCRPALNGYIVCIGG